MTQHLNDSLHLLFWHLSLFVFHSFRKNLIFDGESLEILSILHKLPNILNS